MRARLFLLLGIALMAAGTAVFAAREWLGTQRSTMLTASAAQALELEQTEILVARDVLPAGLLIKPSHVRWQVWPESGLAKSYIVKGEDQTLDDFVGTVVRSGIAEGEPITDMRVVKPGENGFLAAVLAPGKRAVTVPVNATTGIGGFIFPGDRVDLILTHGIDRQADNDRTRRASETVLSNVRVLAIDQSTDDQGAEPSLAKTVTLEVTPKQAEMVTLTTELGRLSLVLRSLQVAEREPQGEERTDRALADTQPPGLVSRTRGRGFTWDSEVSLLLNSPVRSVQVVRGSESSVVEFDGSAR